MGCWLQNAHLCFDSFGSSLVLGGRVPAACRQLLCLSLDLNTYMVPFLCKRMTALIICRRYIFLSLRRIGHRYWTLDDFFFFWATGVVMGVLEVAGDRGAISFGHFCTFWGCFSFCRPMRPTRPIARPIASPIVDGQPATGCRSGCPHVLRVLRVLQVCNPL